MRISQNARSVNHFLLFLSCSSLARYVPLSKAFEYPLPPFVPHPALYAKPVKRKKLMHTNSRAEVFKAHYIRLCKESSTPIFERLLYSLDKAVDSGIESCFRFYRFSKSKISKRRSVGRIVLFGSSLDTKRVQHFLRGHGGGQDASVC